MNQEDFGKLIKKIRKENNLTQKDLANKYNVSYQAVSKWENGINMPDMLLIKKICEDYNISIDEILNIKTNKKIKYYLIIILIIIFAISLFILFNKNSDFEFKTISTTCNRFNISGTIAYNEKKTSIYISNIEYCGGEDNNYYKSIKCTLYESTKNSENIISNYIYDDKEYITLEDFLKNVTLLTNDYVSSCNKENSLYLLIDAIDLDNQNTTYKVPLTLKDVCD